MENKLIISSDEYKQNLCALTGEECEGLSCTSCEIAIRQKECDAEIDRKGVGEFTHKVNIGGIYIMANTHNTIGRLNGEIHREMRSKIPDLVSTTKAYYSDELLEQYPEFKDLKEVLNLNEPLSIFADSDKPAFFVYADAIYLVAPAFNE